jgi:hypothetical protein
MQVRKRHIEKASLGSLAETSLPSRRRLLVSIKCRTTSTGYLRSVSGCADHLSKVSTMTRYTTEHLAHFALTHEWRRIEDKGSWLERWWAPNPSRHVLTQKKPSSPLRAINSHRIRHGQQRICPQVWTVHLDLASSQPTMVITPFEYKGTPPS